MGKRMCTAAPGGQKTSRWKQKAVAGNYFGAIVVSASADALDAVGSEIACEYFVSVLELSAGDCGSLRCAALPG